MRICIVYDCLFPYTVGGAERWYRNLAERLAAAGHEVTYLTRRQWARGERPQVAGVRVVSVAPRMELYVEGGRRRIIPPLVFGAGVLWHLLRHGRRYDLVHTCAFPYFSLLAAALARPRARFGLIVDWHEVWSRSYWREYIGSAGLIGVAVQRLCARVRQRAFCFSQLHAQRLREEGFRGELTVLRGEYEGSVGKAARSGADAALASPLVVFAGRLIPEKRAPTVVPAIALAARRIADLRGIVFGDGPDRAKVDEAITDLGPDSPVSAPGFVDSDLVAQTLARATCMLLPSRREGYGLIVVEAAAAGVPSIVVAGEDNAATELIEEGVNGFVVDSAEPDALADAIVQTFESGAALRASTAAWFDAHASELSLETSLERVLEAYTQNGTIAPSAAVATPAATEPRR